MVGTHGKNNVNFLGAGQGNDLKRTGENVIG